MTLTFLLLEALLDVELWEHLDEGPLHEDLLLLLGDLDLGGGVAPAEDDGAVVDQGVEGGADHGLVLGPGMETREKNVEFHCNLSAMMNGRSSMSLVFGMRK